MKRNPLLVIFMSFVSLIVALAFSCNRTSQKGENGSMPVQEIIEKHRPMNGAIIPEDIKNILGTTHVGGKYWHSQEPYLLEGSKKVMELGFGTIKLWFYKDTWEYGFNSDWGNTLDMTLMELAGHEYFKEVFEMPFHTIFLSTGTSPRCGQVNRDLEQEETEIYELAVYLLETYRDKEINFIIQNWEGDWLLRENYANWLVEGVPENAAERAEFLAEFFRVRQRAVSRAREDAGQGKCKVYHAIEVNKVLDGMQGVPSVTTDILPKISTDMVSWSCYDGMKDTTGVSLYQGIQFIREQMLPTPYMEQEKFVYIGEIGFRENLESQSYVEKCWDTFFGVFLALEIPYVTQWELYCNEPQKQELRHNFEKRRENDEMKGFWLIRSDGSWSHSMNYMDKLMQNAGQAINP